jgi:hypothetical protein
MKTVLTLTLSLLISSMSANAQKMNTDTVVIELANTSKVVFTIQDKADLEQLKKYDFQALFDDILSKIEKGDSIPPSSDSAKELNEPKKEVLVDWGEEDDNDSEYIQKKYSHHRTRHFFNFDFGTNNFLEEGKFPDASGAQYTVRPWGSWYVGLNSVLRTHVSGKFFIEWGTGVSWYNFKFQDDATLITQDVNDVQGVYFTQDTRDVSFVKSKLTVCYINASLVPMIDVGGYNKKARFWNGHNSDFRFGVGPYIGYRIGSHSKLVYKNDGDKEKDKEYDNFYLNNVRYGIRTQIGVRSADFFFNYDLNELFATGKGPKLNAFSFGVIF